MAESFLWRLDAKCGAGWFDDSGGLGLRDPLDDQRPVDQPLTQAGDGVREDQIHQHPVGDVELRHDAHDLEVARQHRLDQELGHALLVEDLVTVLAELRQLLALVLGEHLDVLDQ